MNKLTYVPQWKLRRLAPRAVRIFSRYQELPQLKPYRESLALAAAEFADLYDTSRIPAASTAQWANDAIDALRLVMRGWLPALARDIPGLERAVFTDRQTSGDDVVVSAQRILELSREFKAPAGKGLPYQADLERMLVPAIETAAQRYQEAEARAVAEQELRARTRSAAVRFHKELVAFRRTLRVVLGTNHIDYRKLRGYGSLQHDEAEEVVEDEPTTNAPPASGKEALAAPTNLHPFRIRNTR